MCNIQDSMWNIQHSMCNIQHAMWNFSVVHIIRDVDRQCGPFHIAHYATGFGVRTDMLLCSSCLFGTDIPDRKHILESSKLHNSRQIVHDYNVDTPTTTLDGWYTSSQKAVIFSLPYPSNPFYLYSFTVSRDIHCSLVCSLHHIDSKCSILSHWFVHQIQFGLHCFHLVHLVEPNTISIDILLMLSSFEQLPWERCVLSTKK